MNTVRSQVLRLWLCGAALIALEGAVIAPLAWLRAVAAAFVVVLTLLAWLAPWDLKKWRAEQGVKRRPPSQTQSWAFDLQDKTFRPGPIGWGPLPTPRVLAAAPANDRLDELHANLADAAAGRAGSMDLVWAEGSEQRTLRLEFLAGAYKGHVVGHTQDMTGVAMAASTANALVDAFPTPACLIDADRHILACNGAWNEGGGIEPGSAIGDKAGDAITDTEPARELRARMHRCLSHGNDESWDLRIHRAPHHILIRHLDLADGPAALVVAQPRAKEEHLQNSVRAAERRLTAIIQGAPIAIVQHDVDGKVVDWNGAAQACFGWKRDQALGRLYPPAPPGYEAFFPEWLRASLKAPQLGTQVIRRHEDGRDHRYEAYTAPLRDDEGRATGYVALYVDPADRERVERQATQIEELQSTDALKTTFLSTAAHELATPLTPLKIQLVSLVRTADEANRPRFEMLSRNINRMERLVRDILDAARLESNRLAIEKGRVDTASLATGAIAIFAETAESKGVKLQQDIDEGIVIDGDPIRLDQVVTNLVSNAIKFTPEGGTVSVSVKPLEGGVRIRVHDTGMGLTPEQVDGLFRPFTQFHRKEMGAHIGTGLGLYISQGIVRAHGGSIRCESSGKDRGTTFNVWLPMHVDGRMRGPALDVRSS